MAVLLDPSKMIYCSKFLICWSEIGNCWSEIAISWSEMFWCVDNGFHDVFLQFSKKPFIGIRKGNEEIDSTTWFTGQKNQQGRKVVANQTSIGLTSDQQDRKLFGPKSEIISDQHLQKRVDWKSIGHQFLFSVWQDGRGRARQLSCNSTWGVMKNRIRSNVKGERRTALWLCSNISVLPTMLPVVS
jgi:hypothetical protein